MHYCKTTEQDLIQGMLAQHELTSESLNTDAKNFEEIETHDEVQYTWNNETSDDVTEKLIG